MTKHEAIRQTAQENTLLELGFTRDEAEALRRISMTLHRWAEHECNGDIERNEDEGGKPYRSFAANGGKHYAYRVPDREAGAQKRLLRIINARAKRTGACDVTAYIQGDPRGCALYILRPGDIPPGKSADGYYNRGIAVY
jgi:hypothetical protein